MERLREKQVAKVMKKPRTRIFEYTPEELFVLTLCFSGKIVRDDVCEIYEDKIWALNINQRKIKYLINVLNK